MAPNSSDQTPPTDPTPGTADDEKVAAGSGVSAPTPAEGDDAEREPGSPQG